MAATAHESGLDERQLRKVWRILDPFRSQFDGAALFGSRAIGTHRPNSDIDLVLFGPIERSAVDRIWTNFDESNLSLTVDVVAYDQIKNAALRDHIDRVAIPLPLAPDALDGEAIAAAE